jgi:hypothetical protein
MFGHQPWNFTFLCLWNQGLPIIIIFITTSRYYFSIGIKLSIEQPQSTTEHPA